MSAVAAAPDELDAYALALRASCEEQRLLLTRLRRNIDALGPDRRALGPSADAPTVALRLAVARGEALATEVAGVADAFRAADVVLGRLVGAGTDATGGSAGKGTILPTPDVSVSWSWPPHWTIEHRWGDRDAYAEVELGAGVHAGTGAGIDVTREAIRIGAFAETRIGAWAVGAVGTAIGPFAARASGEVFAGARTRGEALLHIGRDGARVHAGGELFAGATAEGDLRGGIGPVQGGVHGGVSYGIGVTGDADLDLSLERIGGRLEIGAAFGLGWEGGVEYYIEPGWVADGVKELGDELFSIGTDVGDGLADAGGSIVRSIGGWL